MCIFTIQIAQIYPNVNDADNIQKFTHMPEEFVPVPVQVSCNPNLF